MSEDMIQVEPKTLVFESSTNHNETDDRPSTFIIRNRRQSTICFKIKSTATDKVTVRPTCGYIYSFEQIEVKAIAQKHAFANKERPQEKLLIKAAEVNECHNLDKVSASQLMKQIFSDVASTEIKISMVFKSIDFPHSLHFKPSDLPRPVSVTEIKDCWNKKQSMNGELRKKLDDFDSSSDSTSSITQNCKVVVKRACKEQKMNGNHGNKTNHVTEENDSSSNSSSSDINAQVLVKRACGKEKVSNALNHNNKGPKPSIKMSGVESARENGEVTIKNGIESSSDEKESNIRLWADGAATKNNIRSIEKSLQKLSRDIRGTDDSLILLGEKVQAKSRLIQNVQQSLLEKNKEVDHSFSNINSKLQEIDRRLNKVESYLGESINDTGKLILKNNNEEALKPFRGIVQSVGVPDGPCDGQNQTKLISENKECSDDEQQLSFNEQNLESGKDVFNLITGGSVTLFVVSLFGIAFYARKLQK